MDSKAFGFGIAAAFLSAAPALSHHSFAMFDHNKTVTLSGTVKEFEWTNPHSWIHLMVVDKASGKQVQYSIEMASPSQEARVGWKPNTLKPGDKIAVDVHPLKDGSRGGQFMAATLANGTRMRNGGEPNSATGD